MRIKLFVEGYTEDKALPSFLRRWLDVQTSPERIGIKTVRFEGWSEYAKDVAKKANLHLSGKANADVIGVVGLLDLYGPTIYPPGKTTAAERSAWAKAKFEKEVDHPRFRQHFAIHECEAWLLSDPSILPREIASALPGKAARPEEVNSDEPPAKLLERLYREKLRRGYKKVVDGANLFTKLTPEVAREKCPSLKLLMDDLLDLVRNAGP